MQAYKKVLFALLLASAAQGCVPMDSNPDPYGRGGSTYGGYGNDPYYGDPYGRDYNYERRERERLERERRAIDRERADLERERRQLEDERRAKDDDRARRREAEQQREEEQRQRQTCPSGFHPSSSKCSDKERKKGCKDLRIPSGQLCVAGRR